MPDMIQPKAVIQYRLRWTFPGGSTNSRGFEREHFAVKALARLQGRGLACELLVRRVVILEDWAPYLPDKSGHICAHCGVPIQLTEGEWVDSDRQTYCHDAGDSPRHTA